jgi:hypothetical protein
MQKIANYFSLSSASEILSEISAAVEAGHAVDAAILTTFLPPFPSCVASALPVVFSLWDRTLDSSLPLQDRKALDLCCISALAYMAHVTLFPLPTHAASQDALDFINWSPYILTIFSHAARVMCLFNDGNVLYTPPLTDADNLPDKEALTDLSNLIMCLLFISPDAVLPMICSLYTSVEHLLNPLASSDTSKVRNAVVLVWQTSFWFITLISRFHHIPPALQRLQHPHVQRYVQQLMPILLALLPMFPNTAGRCLRRLYLLRPDMVSPALATHINLVLQLSVDCPDAFDCVPVVFREFNSALFVPLHREVDSILAQQHTQVQSGLPSDELSQESSASDIMKQITRVHSVALELPALTRQTGSQADSFAFLQLLPDIAETLLLRVDPGVESSNAALEFFHSLWSDLPCIPLKEATAPTARLMGLSAAALSCVTILNSFFVQPTAHSRSFCARFFSQILVFCEHADQSQPCSVDGEAQMGPKNEVKHLSHSFFEPCVERFLVHLPLDQDASSAVSDGVFTFNNALEMLLQFCSANSALQLPVHTYACVSACMAAHDLITAKKFMPFLMQQLLRPATSEAIKESGADSPMPVRHNRVLSTRNEKVLRYFAGILDTILSSVRSNACRSFIMDFVPQVYDLDKFLLATRQHKPAAINPLHSASKRKKSRLRMRARSSSYDVLHSDRHSNDDLNLAMEFEALSTSKRGDKTGRKHKVKNLFSDGCDLVASLLRCFTKPSVAECAMVPPCLWSSSQWRQIHFVSWGRPVSLDSIEFALEVPTQEHLRCASAIFRKFAIVPLDALAVIINGGAVPEDDIDEFKYLEREISIITSCVRASRMFISPFPDPSAAPHCLSVTCPPPASFGAWLLPSPTKHDVASPSPRPDSLSESSQFEWDGALR